MMHVSRSPLLSAAPQTSQQTGPFVSDDLSVGDVFSPQVEEFDFTLEVGIQKQDTGFRLKPDNNGINGNPISIGSQSKRSSANGGRPTQGSSEYRPNVKLSRRRKKKSDKAAQIVVNRDAPALSTVRGFTPMASGDEDSDFSTASSHAISPRLNPTGNWSQSVLSACGGISALKLQLDAISLSENRHASHATSKAGSQTPSNTSVISDSDHTEVMTSYEVTLEHDYISREATAAERSSSACVITDSTQLNLCKKMTARDFEPITCLGKGTFGTVLLVRHTSTGRLYAQKQVRKASIIVHKKLVEQTKTERVILESVNCHPFVVKLYYAFQDHQKLYLILEYAQGGELFSHLAVERMFSEDVAAFYMAEMVLALEHLHQNIGVIYRDLKPENCLLDAEGHLLLTDFGLSKVAVNEEDRCNSSLGTIEYMAPEVILGKPYGKSCDWWSLGALGYDLLTGSPPFKANNHTKIQEKIVKQKLVLPYFLGPDAKDLLTRLLRKEPHKRLGYHMPKDLVTIKKHRFFRKVDWKALERRDLGAPIKPLITNPALAENFSSDFTGLPLSPVVTSNPPNNNPFGRMWDATGIPCELEGSVSGDADPFSGFSFVAPSSVLNNIELTTAHCG